VCRFAAIACNSREPVAVAFGMVERPSAILCPRCDYDLSSLTQAWQESCPLQGRCSECGLDVRWNELFRPDLVAPSWSFEHAQVRRARAWRVTAHNALRPRRLWKHIRLSAPIKPGRLLLFAVLLVLLTHAAIALAWGIVTAYWSWELARTLARTPLWPGMRPPAAPVIPQWLTDGLTAAAWPYFRSNAATEVIPRFGWWLIVFGLVMPLPFVILADSFQRVKCRRLHLVRGAAMFCPTVCAAAFGIAVLRMIEMNTIAMGGGTIAASVARPLLIALVACVIAFYARWWWVFTRDYLKLEHSLGVVAAMLVVSALLAAVLVTYV
jgi:hypothetical protein